MENIKSDAKRRRKSGDSKGKFAKRKFKGNRFPKVISTSTGIERSSQPLSASAKS